MARRVAGILPAIRGRDALDTTTGRMGSPNAKYGVWEPIPVLRVNMLAAVQRLDGGQFVVGEPEQFVEADPPEDRLDVR